MPTSSRHPDQISLGGRIAAPIIQWADGRYIRGTNSAFTGAASPFEVGTDSKNCSNWTSNAASATAVTGAPMGTGINFYNHGTTLCSTDYYWLLCLQK